jgi:hypothetical protein
MFMTNESIESKLLRCQPIRSFKLERDVAMLFASHGWQVNHSVYYQDPQLNKEREIDVVSSKLWRDPSTARSTRLNIVVECKTNPGYHLVFATPIQPALPHTLHRSYVLDPAALSSVLQRVQDIGVPLTNLSDLRKQLLKESAALEAPIVVFPPSLSVAASSFVETDTKNERTADQSVLWKAALSVRAASKGIKRDSLAKRLNHIATTALASERLGDDVVLNLSQLLTGEVYKDEFFHSMLVLESPMWILAGEVLVSVSDVRLEFRDASRKASSWVDVVSANAAANFIARVSRYYEDMFAEDDMQPVQQF